ncbi:ATP-dependent RecD-like DNA helicase [Bacillus tianshenii]|nr:ATP-dependent RecD-like DNA helicase [Bacillus tianshenii]
MDQQSFPLEEEKKYIKGVIVAMIFHNEDSLYSVSRVRVLETNENYDEKEVIVNGNYPSLHPDETYTFYGKFRTHPKYGKQYNIEHFRKELPSTKEGVVLYLSSDLFHGIGKKTAEHIVDVLGESAISRIMQDPTVLDSVPKLSEEKARNLYETLLEHEGLEQVMMVLSRYGFGPKLSMKVYQAYKEQSLAMIEHHPYQLIEDIEGIGFARADELGQAFGLSEKHPERLRAGCLYLLTHTSLQEGHVYLDIEMLYEEAIKLLDKNGELQLTKEELATEIAALEEEGKVVTEETRIYEPSLYFAEKGFVTSVKRLSDQLGFADEFPESEFLKALGELEERLGVQYAPSQKDAIQKAVSSPMMILTGGPGTGKTTVIKGIVEIYAELHGCSLDVKDYDSEENPFPVLLVAPTGRASKRMSEATGLPAVTIHRLLGWNGSDFEHDEDNPINGKLLIVDEVSMVDMWLANQLFKALPADVQVILVGDEDQLPSVGPGQVLKDLLEADVIPSVQLTDIYRQSEGSSIVEIAHAIKRGEFPHDITEGRADRAFFSCRQDNIADVVLQVCANALKKGYTARDVQVLAPMYRGSAGIEKLNEVLQDEFNPASDQRRELKFADKLYRVGDKVLQLVNQPEDQVFNGDIGEIVSILYAKENVDKEDLTIISFDGTEVQYTRQDLNNITHAYCCSIHKAQGSEFPIVILPIVKGYYRMLRRNLIYTAITRSKDFLILCGEVEAFRMGIERTDDAKRQTSLTERLQAVFQSSEPVENEDVENLSPYDFMDE